MSNDVTGQSGEMPDSQGNDSQELFDGKPFNAETAKALIDKLRRENRDLKPKAQKATELEQAEQKRREEAMSETDKLTKRLQEAEQAKETALRSANDRLIRAAFIAEAAAAGVEFPADAFALADRTNVSVDDSGNVSGVTEAVKALVDAKRLPLRNRTVAGLDSGAGNGQGQRQVTLTEQELAIARKMGIKPEDYAAQKRSKT